MPLLGKPDFSFEREDALKTGRFLLYFIVFYMLASIALNIVVGMPAMQLLVANNVSALLGLFGQSSTVSFVETALVQLQSGQAIEISDLCTGLTETLIIVGAIIASIGISWRKRLLGAAIAAIAVILLNHARIVFTALLILGTSDLALVDFAHNLLFRAFLFVSIAGIYLAWFYWAASSEAGYAKKRPEKKETPGKSPGKKSLAWEKQAARKQGKWALKSKK